MRKKYLIAGVVLALSLSMVGCGKDTGSTTAEGTTENVTTEAEVASDTDTEEATEEEVEEVSTWFSENGISFAEGEVSIPAYTYVRKENGSEDDSEEVTQQDATYSEPVVDVSEPDADGNITYTVTYNASGTWNGTLTLGSGRSCGTTVKNYYFVDAYTGTVFPNADLTDEENSYATDSVVEVDGKEYKISTSGSFEAIYGEPSMSYFENNTKAKVMVDYSINCTMVAVVPAEYDGLILALNGAGATEKEDMDTEIKEAQPFDGNVSDYIFKDVTYGMKLDWNEGNASLIYPEDASGMYIGLHASHIGIYFANGSVIDENEQEKIEKDGYVKIRWKDGTETPVTGEVNYGSAADDPNNSIDSAFIYFNENIDYKQVQSVIVGDIEFTDGTFSKH